MTGYGTHSTTNTRPRFTEKNKDKQYHENHWEYLLGSTSFNFDTIAGVKRAYDYYHGDIDPSEHNHIQMTAFGKKFPMDYINFNGIIGHVRQLKGEFSRKGYDINAVAQSKKALSRRQMELDRMFVQFKLLDLNYGIQEVYGRPMVQEGTPHNPQELQEKQKNFKERGERINDKLIDYWLKKNRWEANRLLVVEDALVAGICGAQNFVTNTGPRFDYLKAEELIWDGNCKDPFATDADYVGVVRFIPLATAIEIGNLDDKAIEKVLNENNPVLIGGRQVTPIQQYGGETYVLYSRMEWKDIEYKDGVSYRDDEGKINYDIINQKGKKPEGKQIPIEVVRYCERFGNCHTSSFGLLENQVRTQDDWQKSQFSITLYLPEWKNGRSASIVEQLIPLQILKDRAMYYLQKAMYKDRGKFWMRDAAQANEESDAEFDMYLAEVLGVVEIHTKMYANNPGYNQFKVHDMSLSADSARVYMEIANMCDMAMTHITGISPARLGDIQGVSQAVGTTEISRRQSTLRTEVFFAGFDHFTEIMMTQVLGLLKLWVLHEPDRAANVIGEEDVRWIQQNPDWAMDDYAAFVTTEYVSDEDKRIIQEYTSNAAMNGMVDYGAGLEVMLSDNPREALEMVQGLIKQMKEEKRVANQQQQMMAMQEMQQKGQTEAMKAQAPMAVAQMNNQGKMERDNLNNQVKMALERLQMAGKQSQSRMQSQDARLASMLKYESDLRKMGQNRQRENV